MTTELEQEFFKAFGIDKKCQCKNFFNYADCFRIPTKCEEYSYPEITDRRLLEMICINSYFCGVDFHHLWVKNPDEIKAIILDEIIRWYQQKKYGHEKCKCQIQQLFKGDIE